MKINYDCLRELLIVLENNLQFNDDLEYPTLMFHDVCNLMPDYTKADIAYSTIMADEAELITANILDSEDCFDDCIYSGLTYEGHKFLENVRNNKVWNTMKKAICKIGGASLEVITPLAAKIVTGMLENEF